MSSSELLIPWPVIVIDDDEFARELVIAHLRKLKLQNPVLVARDGDEACRVLAGATSMPVLVLLDLEMPGRSGLDVLRWLRQQPELAALPVVMLTGSAQIDEVDAAYELGIASYLVKPVGFGALEHVIRQLGLPWAMVSPSAE